MKHLPELLLPAGNLEMAIAAYQGGADAVYAGLQDFNARQRAKNFSINELSTLTDYAKDNHKKIYIVLNTLIKNNETFDIVDTLSLISDLKVDGVIVQDLGLLYLIKKYFNKLAVHSSTQMGIHNSLGISFSQKEQIKRVILSRELTYNELTQISQKSNIELELFVHGSLCYSFSGHCLFSSFLGGMSANRGNCKQPCRRLFTVNKENDYLFSLKDLQLIEFVPDLCKLGIHALKIEGRMKSVDYAYNTATAYRIVLDHPEKMSEAKKILEHDLGREKTAYFLSNSIENSLSNTPSVGSVIGNIVDISNNIVSIKLLSSFNKGSKIRIIGKNDFDTDIIDVSEMFDIQDKNIDKAAEGMIICISVKDKNIKIGDEVYLVSDKSHVKINLPKIKKYNRPTNTKIKDKLIRSRYHESYKSSKPELYLRLDHPEWLSLINSDQYTGIIIAFTKKYWEDQAEFIQKLQVIKSKVYIELPLFISENFIEYYKSFIQSSINIGFRKYSISQIYQLELFENMNDIEIISNESIYCLNDFSIDYIKQHGINRYIYPLENDIDNLFTGKDRNGIIPLFFFPKLFYSRMPLNIKKEVELSDIKNEYRKYIREGMTVVTSKQAVSLFQYQKKLLNKGFSKFLIDVSFTSINQEVLNLINTSLDESINIPQTSKFNFKKGLW